MVINSTDSSALKSYFYSYIHDVLGRSKKSANHYITSLNTISRILREKGYVDNDIFEIKDLEYLAFVRNKILEDPDFIQKNAIGHQMYSVGLNHYFKFATAEGFELNPGQEKLLDIPITPEETPAKTLPVNFILSFSCSLI